MRRIAVFGNYGVGNIGDEQMLQIILHRIRKKGDEPVVFCGVPSSVHEDYAVEAHGFFPVGFRSWLRYFFSASYRIRMRIALRALKSCSVVMFGGGGLFVDQRVRAVFLWRKQLLLSIQNVKKVILLSQNISLRKAYSRFLCIPLLKKVDLVSVRDESSRKLLATEKIPTVLLPDITFLHPPVHPVPIKQDKPILSVSLRKTGLNSDKILALKRFFDELSTFYDIRLLVFQTTIFDDREVYRIAEFLFPVVSGDKVFSVLERSAFVIAMRYHTLVFAVQANIPFLALSYQPKVRSFAEDVQMNDYVVDVVDISFSALKKKFQNLEFQKKSVKKILANEHDRMKNMLKTYDSVFEY